MTLPRKILIAADAPLKASLAEQFETLVGVELCEAPACLSGLAPPWPDVLVLDDKACGDDAAASIARFRQAGFTGAAIVISSDDRRCPGAAATLKRPFRFADLAACIAAAHSPAAARADPPPAARLTEKEAAIFARLMQADGAVVSKATLLSEVWGYGPNVSTRTLETHIHRLRRKIEADPARPRRLLTEYGGYRLAAPVDNSESGAVVPLA